MYNEIILSYYYTNKYNDNGRKKQELLLGSLYNVSLKGGSHDPPQHVSYIILSNENYILDVQFDQRGRAPYKKVSQLNNAEDTRNWTAISSSAPKRISITVRS